MSVAFSFIILTIQLPFCSSTYVYTFPTCELSHLNHILLFCIHFSHKILPSILVPATILKAWSFWPSLRAIRMSSLLGGLSSPHCSLYNTHIIPFITASVLISQILNPWPLPLTNKDSTTAKAYTGAQQRYDAPHTSLFVNILAPRLQRRGPRRPCLVCVHWY